MTHNRYAHDKHDHNFILIFLTFFSCTNAKDWGCSRTGNAKNILNPIKSARIRTVYSFAYKYGKMEVRAKLPTGDWLWPGKFRFIILLIDI